MIVLPDLPNHGRSPHISSSTHEAMVDVVEQFISDQRLANPVIGGHSIGGKLAMLMAIRNPARYPALLCIDMAPRVYEASHHEILDAMTTLPLETVTARRDADRHMSEAVPSAGVRSFLLKNLVRDGETYRWRLNLNAITSDYESMLGWSPPAGAYPGPSLFVGGERSRYLQEKRDSDAIRTWFPTAMVRMIANAGHWLHADRPDEVVAVLGDFLSANLP
jgi:esterase